MLSPIARKAFWTLLYSFWCTPAKLISYFCWTECETKKWRCTNGEGKLIKQVKMIAFAAYLFGRIYSCNIYKGWGCFWVGCGRSYPQGTSFLVQRWEIIVRCHNIWSHLSLSSGDHWVHCIYFWILLECQKVVGGIEMIFAYEVAMRCLCFAMEPMQMEKLLSIWGVGGLPVVQLPFWSSLIAMDSSVLYLYQSFDKRVNIWKTLCTLIFWRANAH